MLISRVELPVSNAAQAAAFYRDILGLPTRADDDIVEVQVGASGLMLGQQRCSPAPTTAP
jgi:catechol 2,3-dioxygenase-like lactoylglutathione lyase family enzyme